MVHYRYLLSAIEAGAIKTLTIESPQLIFKVTLIFVCLLLKKSLKLYTTSEASIHEREHGQVNRIINKLLVQIFFPDLQIILIGFYFN